MSVCGVAGSLGVAPEAGSAGPMLAAPRAVAALLLPPRPSVDPVLLVFSDDALPGNPVSLIDGIQAPEMSTGNPCPAPGTEL